MVFPSSPAAATAAAIDDDATEELPGIPNNVTNEDSSGGSAVASPVSAAVSGQGENDEDEDDANEDRLEEQQPRTKRQKTDDAAPAAAAADPPKVSPSDKNNQQGQDEEAANGAEDMDVEVEVEEAEAPVVATNEEGKSCAGEDEEEEVQVMSPPPPSPPPPPSQQSTTSATANPSARTAADTDDDDEIQVQSCNVTNPTIHFSHLREQCGVHPFDAAAAAAATAPNGSSKGHASDEQHFNTKYCAKCFCYVCDVLASECTEWNTGGNQHQHCHACSGDVTWTAIRQMKQAASRTGTSISTGAAASGNANNNNEVITIDDDSPVVATAARRRVRRANVADADNQQKQRRDRIKVLANIMGGSVAPIDIASTTAAAASSSSSKAYVEQQQMAKAINELDAEQLGAAANAGSSAAASAEEGEQHTRRTKTREQMRITEVLSENFRKVLTLTAGGEAATAAAAASATASASTSSSNSTLSTAQTRRRMEGDIPQLGLHSSFFVEGIRIGWPYPMVMQPQRQMAIHLIKALKNRRHVVLESPTGTGKSAAILCSALAWQRYHAKTAEGSSSGSTPRIIYCSRTHSQVAQMVASLKKTPYRPRMAILGSRERMCINKDIRPRAAADKGSSDKVNVNNECRIRIRNTEKYRKSMWRSHTQGYDDDDPPEEVVGDRAADAATQTQQAEAADEANEDGFRSKNRKMCSHYRQLTTNRVAALAHSMFTPNEKAVSCCSLGGEKTKFGAHDIEDLVSFGVTPHTLSGVAIYRGDSPSVGLQLSESPGSGCCIGEVKENGAAKVEGTLRQGDRISKLNGEDVRNLPLADVASKFRSATEDPIMLDVVRGDEHRIDDDDYSPHAACPYYLSQILAKNAELVFAPYNYVLEPAIRNALGIDLEGSVVVLDEAHNVEDTLRESGSCKLPEFELCELLLVLSNYSTMEKHHTNLIKVSLANSFIPIPNLGGEYAPNGANGPDGTMYISDVAHSILLFLERIIEFLHSSKDRFEKNPGNKGADFAIREWRKYHTPDDKEFEVTYDGPTGLGHSRKAVGCRTFFDKLQISLTDLDQVVSYAEALAEHVRGTSQEQEQRSMNQMDRLLELVVKFSAACKKPEHFYIASVVSANGSLAYAAGDEDESNDGSSRFKKKPKQLPYAPPRTQAYPDRPVNPCNHQICRRNSAGNAFNVVRHASYCNGSTPKWEASLVLNLLSPGLPMRELADQCRTVVLASGSLAPLPSLCGELNLFPPKENTQVNNTADVKVTPNSSTGSSEVDLERYGRLQVHPKPLEANHVVNLQKQLLAVSIGHFPDGSPLSVKYSTYSKPDFIPKLGDAIASIIESIPSGGVLVFLPSYSFLRKCVNSWNPFASRRGRFRFGAQDDSDVWDRILESKKKIIVEETGNQEKFEQSRNEYNETVSTQGSCVLFAVYRGKMSEGVSFNDDYARGVICVGIPLPNAYDTSIRAKKNYNNEQRRLRNRNNLLPGDDWYQQQAYRAIAQALGRCIRHAADYGTIVLLDSRHCDDGAPSLDGSGVCGAHKNLPKWMRGHVKNLVRNRRGVGGMHQYLSAPDSKFIQGGWTGLSQEMKRFFREAKPHAESVLASHQSKLAKAQERDQKAQRRKFDSKTGTWSSIGANGGSVSTTAASSSSASTTRTNSSNAPPVQPKEEPVAKASSDTMTSVSSTRKQYSQPASQPSPSVSQVERTPSTTASRPQYLSSRERIQRALPQKKPPQNTLHALFHRQRSAAGNAEPATATVTCTPAANQQQEQEQQQQGLSRNERLTSTSPTTATNLGSALKATRSSTTTSQASSTAPSQNGDNEDNYCIICEEASKRVVLLPCKHLCLCTGCSRLEKLVDCPMCRTKIEDRLEVFM